MLGTWDKRTSNNQRIMTNQIQQVVKLLLSYPQMYNRKNEMCKI